MDNPEIKELLKEIYDLDEKFIPLRNKRAILRESIISKLKIKGLSSVEYKNLQVKSINRSEKINSEDALKLKEYLTEHEYDYIFEPNLTRLKKIRNNLNVNAKNFINKILKSKIGYIIKYSKPKDDEFFNSNIDNPNRDSPLANEPKTFYKVSPNQDNNKYDYENVSAYLKETYSTNIEESQRQSGLIDYAEIIKEKSINFKDDLRTLCIALKNLGFEDEENYNPQLCDDDTEFLRIHYSDYLGASASINTHEMPQPRPLSGDWREDPTSKI